MKILVSALLAAIGLLNLYPLVGVLSADQLGGLYGTAIDSVELEILMRHRAVMLGLIGGLLMLAAFRPSLRLPAASIGLVSMAAFVGLAYLIGDFGPEINRVVVADIVGSVVAIVAIVLILRERV